MPDVEAGAPSWRDGGAGGISRWFTVPPPQELVYAVLLVALALGWRLFLHRQGRQGTWRLHRVAVTAILRMVLTSAAAAWAPVRVLPLSRLPLPCPFQLTTSGIGLYFNVEALFLLSLALLLPLPLKHHLWAQALTLRSALARMRHLARLHALLPHRAAECARFVRCARLAMLAVFPGGATHLQRRPQLQHCCWMLHVFTTVVLGYALPSAVQFALAQHRRQERHRLRHLRHLQRWGAAQRSSQQRQPQALTPPSPAASRAELQSSPEPGAQPGRRSASGAPGGAAGGVAEAVVRMPSASASPTSPASSSLSLSLSSTSLSTSSSVSRLSSDFSVWSLTRAEHHLLTPLLLASRLTHLLLLLVPSSALVWASLELAAYMHWWGVP